MELIKPIDELVDGMLLRQFSEDSGEGFIVSKKSSRLCSGKYVNRFTVVDSYADPYGDIHEVERIVYNTVNFSIVLERNLNLELYSPPSRIRPFFNALDNLMDDIVVVSQSHIDPLEWLAKIKEDVRGIKLNSIECSGINIENKGTAKVSIKSKQDIKNEAFKYLGSYDYTVDSIKCSYMQDSTLFKFSLNKSGMAKLSEENEKLLLPILRDSLNAVCMKV
jgi:hypothetical protein